MPSIHLHAPLAVVEGFDIAEVCPLNIVDCLGDTLAAITNGAAPLQPADYDCRQVAKLFAASPDLLDIVRRLVAWDNDDRAHSGEDIDWAALDRLALAARALIKKLEG